MKVRRGFTVSPTGEADPSAPFFTCTISGFCVSFRLIRDRARKASDFGFQNALTLSSDALRIVVSMAARPRLGARISGGD
jgi:hypothetical protein